MPTFKICISDFAYYKIEAETEDEAVNLAYEYWDERTPKIDSIEVDEED